MGETCEGAGASSCNWRYVHTHTFISLGLATEQPVCVCCCPSPATSIASHSAIESNCCFSQPPSPIMAHLRRLQHQRHHLLHANFHSFGNYFRTLSAPMARTRWHIMYSTAPWKLHQLRNRCIYFGNRARAMSLNPCTNQTGSGIRITAHLLTWISAFLIIPFDVTSAQLDRQTDRPHSQPQFYLWLSRGISFDSSILCSCCIHRNVTPRRGKSSMATFLHYICMLYGWSRLIGLKAIILSNSQNVYQYSCSSLTFEIINIFEQTTHRNDRKSATKLCDYNFLLSAYFRI